MASGIYLNDIPIDLFSKYYNEFSQSAKSNNPVYVPMSISTNYLPTTTFNGQEYYTAQLLTDVTSTYETNDSIYQKTYCNQFTSVLKSTTETSLYVYSCPQFYPINYLIYSVSKTGEDSYEDQYFSPDSSSESIASTTEFYIDEELTGIGTTSCLGPLTILSVKKGAKQITEDDESQEIAASFYKASATAYGSETINISSVTEAYITYNDETKMLEKTTKDDSLSDLVYAPTYDFLNGNDDFDITSNDYKYISVGKFYGIQIPYSESVVSSSGYDYLWIITNTQQTTYKTINNRQVFVDSNGIETFKPSYKNTLKTHENAIRQSFFKASENSNWLRQSKLLYPYFLEKDDGDHFIYISKVSMTKEITPQVYSNTISKEYSDAYDESKDLDLTQEQITNIINSNTVQMVSNQDLYKVHDFGVFPFGLTRSIINYSNKDRLLPGNALYDTGINDMKTPTLVRITSEQPYIPYKDSEIKVYTITDIVKSGNKNLSVLGQYNIKLTCDYNLGDNIINTYCPIIKLGSKTVVIIPTIINTSENFLTIKSFSSFPTLNTSFFNKNNFNIIIKNYLFKIKIKSEVTFADTSFVNTTDESLRVFPVEVKLDDRKNTYYLAMELPDNIQYKIHDTETYLCYAATDNSKTVRHKVLVSDASGKLYYKETVTKVTPLVISEEQFFQFPQLQLAIKTPTSETNNAAEDFLNTHTTVNSVESTALATFLDSEPTASITASMNNDTESDYFQLTYSTSDYTSNILDLSKKTYFQYTTNYSFTTKDKYNDETRMVYTDTDSDGYNYFISIKCQFANDLINNSQVIRESTIRSYIDRTSDNTMLRGPRVPDGFNDSIYKSLNDTISNFIRGAIDTLDDKYTFSLQSDDIIANFYNRCVAFNKFYKSNNSITKSLPEVVNVRILQNPPLYKVQVRALADIPVPDVSINTANQSILNSISDLRSLEQRLADAHKYPVSEMYTEYLKSTIALPSDSMAALEYYNNKKSKKDTTGIQPIDNSAMFKTFFDAFLLDLTMIQRNKFNSDISSINLLCKNDIFIKYAEKTTRQKNINKALDSITSANPEDQITVLINTENVDSYLYKFLQKDALNDNKFIVLKSEAQK